MKARYYWPTMFQDAYDYVKQCKTCQYYVKNNLHMTLSLYIFLLLFPFEKWEIDYIGEINPNSSKAMKYIVIAMEYLKKWS